MQQQLIQRLPFFQRIEWVEHTNSTNADLLQLARQRSGPLMRPWLLGAHLQHQGRGRAGRTWENRRGAHLMFSCAFDVFLPAKHLATLSPLAGVTAAEALRSLLPIHDVPKLNMKWPNDLLWHRAKLAGILTEATRAGTTPLSVDHHVVIIGIGLNLNSAVDLSHHLQRPIAAWEDIVQEAPSLSQLPAIDLVTCIAQHWYDALNEVTASGFKRLVARHHRVDALYNQALDIIDQGQTLLSGLGAGINERGQLLLRDGSHIHEVSVGEVSVRPTSSNPHG